MADNPEAVLIFSGVRVVRGALCEAMMVWHFLMVVVVGCVINASHFPSQPFSTKC